MTTLREANLPRDAAELAALTERHLGRPAVAVMLYGSHARRAATDKSDIDILAIVEDRPGSYGDGDVNVTAYRGEHLAWLASRGSLFVLHLVVDGVVVKDDAGRLREALSEYRPPADPDSLSREVKAAAEGLMQASPAEVRQYRREMFGLAVYLARTAAYDMCARMGRPEFDALLALQRLGAESLLPVLANRRHPEAHLQLESALEGLSALLSVPHPQGPSGLAAAAVAASETYPLASRLLSDVLAGGVINYTTLSLPPA